MLIECLWKHFQAYNASSFQCTFAPQRLIGEIFQFDFFILPTYTALLHSRFRRSVINWTVETTFLANITIVNYFSTNRTLEERAQRLFYTKGIADVERNCPGKITYTYLYIFLWEFKYCKTRRNTLNLGKTTEEFDSSLFAKSKGSKGRYRFWHRRKRILLNIVIIYSYIYIYLYFFLQGKM